MNTCRNDFLPLTFGSDGIRVNLRASSVRSLPLSSSRLRLILFMNLSGCRWWAEIRELLKLNPCSSSCSPESRTTGETGGHTLRKTNSREDNALKHFARPMLLLSRRNLLSSSPPSCPSASTNELPLDTDNTTERLTRGSIGETTIQQVENSGTLFKHLP